ncbi:hypothetical protein MLD38_037378 [Melastoma candidum]|uniref:Uncharacterized protein n=1 Tax=Melastoma candidum TaxID=119954 RepID=A0ACB9LNC1_9MYRT|nr:hypothetical protein MLD38_037378 [Melastoma candidum]
MDDFLKEFFPKVYRGKQMHLHETDYCKYDNRLLTLDGCGFVWAVAMACESWFTFIWILTFSNLGNPIAYRIYPHLLSHREEREFPPIDMFVTTADPASKPPFITANTVLSLLALDYPADKLACFVSDDCCSSLTYCSLREASEFAKSWVPFSKKYRVQTRAPFRYFTDHDSKVESSSEEFR